MPRRARGAGAPAQRESRSDCSSAPRSHHRRGARATVTRRCASTPRASTASSSTSFAVDAGGVRRRGGGSSAREQLAAMRSRHRQRAALPRRAAARAAAPRDVMPGVRCERVLVPIPRRRPVRARRLGAAALHRDHAGRAGAHRRLPGARAVHAAAARTARANAAVLVAARLCGVEQVFKARRRAGDGGDGLRHGERSQGGQDLRSRHGAGSRRPSSSWPPIPAARRCDLPAGPSEVLVIADESARPEFVAADLLAQAEHDARRAGDAGDHLARARRGRASAEVDRQRPALSRARSLEQSVAQLPGASLRAGPRRPRSRFATATRPST